MTKIDIKIGQLYGAWLVEKDLGVNSKFACVCKACGKTRRNIRAHDLISGKSKMCKSCTTGKVRGSTTDSKTSLEYNSWVSAVQRTTNPNCKDYKNYGARGITMDPMWLESFEAFYMSVGPRPTPTCTIERIDYNKGYVPGNVKWLEKVEQPKNKRDNVNLTINGETKLISEWALDPRAAVSANAIYKRNARGWDDEECVMAPLGFKRGQYAKKES